jgi:YVTN family beta-propeller protein
MGIEATPDARYILVTNDVTDGAVTIIDTRKQAVVNTIPVGTYATGVVVTSDSRFAYVPSGDVSDLDASVTVIDLSRQVVVNKIPLGVGAAAIGNFMGPNLIS